MVTSSTGSSKLHGTMNAGTGQADASNRANRPIHEALYRSATSSHVQAKSGWLGSANVGATGASLLDENDTRAPPEIAKSATPLPTSRDLSPSHRIHEERKPSDSKNSRRGEDIHTGVGAVEGRYIIPQRSVGPTPEEALSVRVEALTLDTNAQKHHAQPVLSLHCPHTADPIQGSWSFKKILMTKGLDAEPTKPKAPSQEYLAISREESKLLKEIEIIGQRPKLLVLDLNQTLLTRKRSTSKSSKNPTPRPYLSNFLEYICGSDEVSPGIFQRRFNVMVWSSAEADNVTAMCDSMQLFTETGSQAPLLVDVWDRSSLGLTPEQMKAKFSTVKDLSQIWREMRYVPHASTSVPCVPNPASKEAIRKINRWSQLDTILIDDTPSKAALQPYNHLHITSMVRPSKLSGLSSYSDTAGNGTGTSDCKPDTCLVQIVAILENLRYHSNISYAIASGDFGGLGDGEQGEIWAKEGFEILKAKGIKVTRDFDKTWTKRVLQGSSG